MLKGIFQTDLILFQKAMNLTSEKYGLSARQRTIYPLTKNVSRIRCLWVFFIAGCLMLCSCHEKTNGQNKAEGKKNASPIEGDSLTKPKVNIKVNRHYDEKGNVIGFDSTYSSYYSNVQGDTTQMDSLMSRFNRFFDQEHSSFFRKEFDPLFFNDSLRYPDFFHDDFFMKRYELNDPYFRNMMQRMDSIKNHFYQEQSKKEKRSEAL
jgi:hypothetical protein